MENNEIKEETNKISLAELEELLTKDIKPPGILEYDDMPPEYEQTASESKIDRIKKVNYILLALGK